MRPSRAKNISGQRFGRLVAVELVGVNRRYGVALWRCHCDCGQERVISGASLRKRDGSKSCGCSRQREEVLCQ